MDPAAHRVHELLVVVGQQILVQPHGGGGHVPGRLRVGPRRSCRDAPGNAALSRQRGLVRPALHEQQVVAATLHERSLCKNPEQELGCRFVGAHRVAHEDVHEPQWGLLAASARGRRLPPVAGHRLPPVAGYRLWLQKRCNFLAQQTLARCRKGGAAFVPEGLQLTRDALAVVTTRECEAVILDLGGPLSPRDLRAVAGVTAEDAHVRLILAVLREHGQKLPPRGACGCRLTCNSGAGGCQDQLGVHVRPRVLDLADAGAGHQRCVAAVG